MGRRREEGGSGTPPGHSLHKHTTTPTLTATPNHPTLHQDAAPLLHYRCGAVETAKGVRICFDPPPFSHHSSHSLQSQPGNESLQGGK